LIISDLRYDRFTPKSEKPMPDPYRLPVEDVEIAEGIPGAAPGKGGDGDES
jgi:hypothetical protein